MSSATYDVFRRPDRRRFAAVQSERSEPIVRALERDGPVLITDLTLGPFRPHHIARELAAQLGVALPRAPRGSFASTDDSVQNIEAEIRGDRGRLGVLRLGRALTGSLAREHFHIVVLAPRAGAAWGEANLDLLDLVADILSGSTPSITLAFQPGGRSVPPPARWPLELRAIPPTRISRGFECVDDQYRLVPGLILDGAAKREDGVSVVCTARGARFIEPSDRVAGVIQRPIRQPWIRCYEAARAGGPYAVRTLERGAMAALDQCDVPLAIALGERAIALAQSDIERAEVLYWLQILRIRACRYADAASADIPFYGVAPPLLQQLYASTGYAAAIQGDPGLAECFLRAASPGRSVEEWPDLFARNAMALALARSGDTDGALAIEQAIARELQRQPGAFHLRALNALNLARLYRMRGDHQRARAGYLRWARVIRGSAIESELLYANFCLARAADELCTPGEAFRRWIRGTLHWAAQPDPECLNWRTTSAILGRPSLSSNVDEICAIMEANLRRAALAAGVQPCMSDAAATFAYVAEGSSARNSLFAIHGRGLGLLASETERPPVYDSIAHCRMRRLLKGLLVTTIGPGVAAAQTYYLDASLGYDLPSTTGETLDSAVRHDATRLVSSAGAQTLDDAACRQWEAASWVERSAGVASVAARPVGAVVSFKRHWPSLLLDEHDARVVAHIGDGVITGAAFSNRTQFACVRSLEFRRIVRIRGVALGTVLRNGDHQPGNT